jgi:hypothetical protein
MVQMSDDYFTKLNKGTQVFRDMFAPKKAEAAPKLPTAPKAPKAPEAVKKVGELQGESLEDYTYMHDAVTKIGKKLAPKSVMGKSSGKR